MIACEMCGIEVPEGPSGRCFIGHMQPGAPVLRRVVESSAAPAERETPQFAAAPPPVSQPLVAAAPQPFAPPAAAQLQPLGTPQPFAPAATLQPLGAQAPLSPPPSPPTYAAPSPLGSLAPPPEIAAVLQEFVAEQRGEPSFQQPAFAAGPRASVTAGVGALASGSLSVGAAPSAVADLQVVGHVGHVGNVALAADERASAQLPAASPELFVVDASAKPSRFGKLLNRRPRA